MSRRILLVLLACMMLFAYGCTAEEPDNSSNADSEAIINDTENDLMIRIDWGNASGVYLRDDGKVALNLTDSSDDIGVYYDVEFVDHEKELTLISVESCGEITDDDVLRIDVSENDTICLSIIKDERDVDSIVVSGTYEGKDFQGNGTYYIAAG